MSSVSTTHLSRRELVKLAIAAGGGLAASPVLGAGGLDPADPAMRFGVTGSIFAHWEGETVAARELRMSTNMEAMLRACKSYGFEGFEPYSGQVADYATRPAALKSVLDRTGMMLASVGDLPRHFLQTVTSTGPSSTGQYPWLGGEGREQLIASMEACARDFLQPLGVDHWKNNMGARPEAGPSDDQLKRLAETCNEIGRRTLRYGVKLSLHPHLWGPMEREHEFRRVMELTDPAYVYMILDTGHNVLGGMDVVKITQEYLPRMTEVHLKDTFPQYRGNKATPTRLAHLNKNVYAAIGQGGGVDFPGVFRVLRAGKFKGWCVIDIDAPRVGDGTGTIHDNLAASVNYMRSALKLKLPVPPRTAPYSEAAVA